MRYYVLTSDGQRYGPADLATLQQWVNEGRILANTNLEDETSGNRLQASAVPGLNFGGGTPQANPYSSGAPGPYGNATQTPPQGNPYSQNPYSQGGGYYRPTNQPGYGTGYDAAIQKDITNAWVGGVIGLLCCGPFAIWGLICAGRAKQAGHPGAQAPYVFNIVALVIWVLLFIVRIGAIGSSF